MMEIKVAQKHADRSSEGEHGGGSISTGIWLRLPPPPRRKFKHAIETRRSCGDATPPWWYGRWQVGAHEAPNFQTAIPRRLALSARLSWIPVPGKCMTPIGSSSSMASLRLNGAAFACFAQSGLKAICGTLRLLAHLEAISSAPFGEPP